VAPGSPVGGCADDVLTEVEVLLAGDQSVVDGGYRREQSDGRSRSR
jgi:hypothetical protein